LSPENRLEARRMMRWIDRFHEQANALLKNHPEITEFPDLVQAIQAAQYDMNGIKKRLNGLLRQSE